MADKNHADRISYALQTLRDARGELTSEARWLRNELDPRRMAHRAVDNHTTGMLATAFGAGLVIAWLIFHKATNKSKQLPQPIEARVKPQARGGIGGMLVKTAVPFVLKLATSKPFLEKVMGLSRAVTAHRARATV
jgi:hypothetical protein